MKRLHEVSYPDDYNYLVDTACVYTRHAVKINRIGNVGNICSYNVDDICVVFGEAEASQLVSKTHIFANRKLHVHVSVETTSSSEQNIPNILFRFLKVRGTFAET